MPISGESFEKGEILPRAEVVAFLRVNVERAYTKHEVFRALITDTGSSIEQIEGALENLRAEGKVESRVIGGEAYYRFLRPPLGFRPPRRE